MKVRNIIFMVIVFTLLLSSGAPMMTYATNAGIGIIINGKALVLDQPPVMENGRTLVPLRAIFEELGAKVQWDGATQTITGTKGQSTIKLVVGNTVATVDGKEVKLDVPAKVVRGRTLVPTRFVAESLGATVVWDGGNRVVRITAETPKVASTTAEDYIEAFDVTFETVIENLLKYSTALIMASFGDFKKAKRSIEEITEETKGFQDEFYKLSEVKEFRQSQFYMRRTLYYYDLYVEAIGVLVDIAIEDEDNVDEIMRVTENILKYLKLFEKDLDKAIEFFIQELEDYENNN